MWTRNQCVVGQVDVNKEWNDNQAEEWEVGAGGDDVTVGGMSSLHSSFSLESVSVSPRMVNITWSSATTALVLEDD